jgi:microtubule-associated protein, RP/EB family
MMDAAYFLGRRELLDFFNELLVLQLQKIEQTASGAIACQLTEYIFPNSIPMSKYVLRVVMIEPALCIIL